MRPLFLFGALMWANCTVAQLDSVQVLTRTALLQLVSDNHPAVRQAGLRTEMGEAVLRSARGAFDPKAIAGYTEKTFDEQEYYKLLDAGLKVPTWFGAEVFGGFQNTEGDYLNDADRTPDAGLIKAGVSVTLGQGLFIDKRRADLRKAQAFQDMADAERLQLLNEVYYEALTDHIQWVAAFKQLTVARSAISRAEVRLQAVRGSFRGGDRPAIDTLEALLQVQDRIMRLQQAEVDLRNAALVLSNHLWDPYLRPLEIDRNVQPDTTDLTTFGARVDNDSLIALAMEEHPKLLELRSKLEQLEVEKRLRQEYLKPQLDLNYSLLGNAGMLSDGSRTTFDPGDRQWGFGFSMPLMLRKERGDLSLAKLRAVEAEIGIERERQQIRTTVGRRTNELALMNEQVRLGEAMVRNYSGLLSGENKRFAAGESSLFLVNQREVALLDNQMKLIELQAKLGKAELLLEKDTGTLWRSATDLLRPAP